MQQSQSCGFFRRLFIFTLVCTSVLLAADSSHAATYFVGKSGNDTHSCLQAQSRTTTKLSMNGAIPCVLPGDTVIVLPGEYAESILNFPGGTSWAVPVILRADIPQTAILRPGPGPANVLRFASAASQYIIIDGLDIDAVNVGFDAIKITSGTGIGQSNFIRIINCIVRNAPLNGIFVDGSGNEFIDTEIRDNGVDILTHGIYIAHSGNLVDGCMVTNNTGYGIHVFSDAMAIFDNIVRNNVVFLNGIGPTTAGIIISSGARNTAYDNMVFQNDIGIQVDYSDGAHVYRNVITDNARDCISIGPMADQTLHGDNICLNNAGGIVDLGLQTREFSFGGVSERGGSKKPQVCHPKWSICVSIMPIEPASQPHVALAGDIPHVFIRGIDNHIYHSPATSGGQRIWTALGGATLSVPTAVEFRHTLWAFVQGTDNRIYMNQQSQEVWQGWEEVPGGGVTPSGPTALVFHNNLYLFVQGIDNRIYLNRFDGLVWSGWNEIPGGGHTRGTPAAAVSGETLSVFVQGLDHRIYHTAFAVRGWTGWHEVAGHGVTASGPAVTVFQEDIWLFVRGTDDHLYQNVFSTAGWSSWSEVTGGGRTPAGPSAATVHGQIWLFAQGTDEHIYRNILQNFPQNILPEADWTGWRAWFS